MLGDYAMQVNCTTNTILLSQSRPSGLRHSSPCSYVNKRYA